jgi:outer membrane protein insertion porin family
MGGFNRTTRDRKGFESIKKSMLRWVWIQTLFIIAASGAWIPKSVEAESKGRVAVLPFKIYAPEPLHSLALSFQETLTAQLKKTGFQMISPGVVNRHPLAFLPDMGVKDSIRIGKEMEADWIVSGSLTQVGDKVSIDLSVTDVTEEKKPFFLFEVSDTIDTLPETAGKLAAGIDNQIGGAVQVDSVRVEGNQRIEAEAILAVIKTKKGDRLDYEQLDNDLRSIYGMGFFTDVKIETEDGPKGKIVTLDVTEKSSIGKIVIEGNKKENEKDLQEQLGLKLYSILDENEVRQSVNRLKEYYRLKGFFNVDIEYGIEPLANNQVLVRYEITENEKVYIREINFVGNKEFDDDALKDVMETAEKGFFSWFTKSGLLDKNMLAFDVGKLTSFYHNKGFIKAKVGEPKISYEKGKGLAITIEIDEGLKYDVGAVAIEGDLVKPVDALLKKVRIHEEKAFNREVVRQDVLALRSIYANEGYAYAEIRPRTDEDNETRRVDITYGISKGEKVRFERINISGNTSTRDKVIRRELKVIEGEYFSGSGIRRSTRNLQRLGFFEDVQIQTRKGSEEDLMVLDIQVKERATGTFSMGAGFSSEDGAFGVFEISQENLFGRGQKLIASAKIGGTATRYDLRFVEPWFLDKPISAGIDLFNRDVEYDEYTRASLGGALRLGFPLGIDEFTRGSVRYGYDDSDISDVEEDASVAIKDMEGRNVTSGMTFAITRDSRDRLFLTSRGSYNSISFEYTGGIFGGDVYFNKYQATSGWYFPLFWDTVFLVRGSWGLVEERSGGFLPVYQKFRIGGINTVRGFDFGDISPIDPETGDRIGGEKMMYYNVEYRVPLLKEQGIVGLVFFDAGNVFTEDENWTFEGIRTSAGGGIRWYSPVGPIRLEYGVNLDPKEDEPSGSWEFSMGGTF